MNEIEKMYENAGLSNMWVEEYDDNQIWHKSYNKMVESMMKVNDWSRKVAVEVAKKECRKALPPFTAEKQLSLTTFIGLHYGFQMFKNEAFDYIIATRIYVKFEYEYKGYGYGYDEAIANLINNIWQDLTEEEKEQIKEILK